MLSFSLSSNSFVCYIRSQLGREDIIMSIRTKAKAHWKRKNDINFNLLAKVGVTRVVGYETHFRCKSMSIVKPLRGKIDGSTLPKIYQNKVNNFDETHFLM